MIVGTFTSFVNGDDTFSDCKKVGYEREYLLKVSNKLFKQNMYLHVFVAKDGIHISFSSIYI